jgi:hypothetical protein
MYDTMTAIREASARSSQPHWFSESTMRFFDTRVETQGRPIAGYYFVTSDKAPGSERRYTVRKANDDGTIETVGDFQQHDTYAEARTAAIHAAASDE